MKSFDAYPEVLAPAGSPEALYAAVRAGADAVYLGLEDFNARRNARNFSLEELKEAATYCRERGVKVYLTLNISLFDKELDSALSVAYKAMCAGVDAFIVADLGLASLIKSRIPSAVLHGSTQLSVMSPAALPILKKLGFARVVAAREMSKKELEVFCKKAAELDIEVEVFVHGALCMSVSGQCHFSAILGSRSGNRGLCAAPCRLPAKVESGTGYDLSLKDLSLLDELDSLKQMGVCSLKIEGRRKRAEYTAAAVNAFRCKIDGQSKSDIPPLEEIFSRSGFTKGYFDSALGREMFGIKADEENPSAKTLAKVHELYRAERQSVGVSLKFSARLGEPIKLQMSDYIHSVSVLGDTPSPAANKPLTAEDAAAKLSKLGSTPFFAENVVCDIDDNLYLSAASINSLRSDAANKLLKIRGSLPQVTADLSAVKRQKPRQAQPALAARFSDISLVPENAKNLAFLVLPAEQVESFNFNIPVIAELPRASADDEMIKRLIEKSISKGAAAVLVGSIAQIELAKKLNAPFITSFGLNIFNSYSAKAYEELGAAAHLLPFEPASAIIKGIATGVPRGSIVYGRLPLMLTRNCPIRNGRTCADCDKKGYITDRKNAKLPVFCRGGFSEVYNSVPLYLADKPELFYGLDFGLLWFTDESKSDAENIIELYNNNSAPPFPYTRGLTTRGVE